MRWGFVVAFVLVALPVLLVLLEPGCWGQTRSAPITSATLQAGGIHKACMLYAQDHEGRFPTGEGGAVTAFRKLFPEILQEERPFYITGSAWHDEAPKGRPDEDIGVKPDFAQCLERGENHWAYVTGLTETSDPKLPLIADGFVEGQPGVYTDQRKQKGGVWMGRRAVVVYVSGAAKAEPLSATTGFRVQKTRTEADGTSRQVDLFSREGGLPEGTQVLNPW
jgi:hypothetical protein